MKSTCFGMLVPIRMKPAQTEECFCVASAATRSLDCSDVDLLHAHHRLKRALRFTAAGSQRLGQHARCDLPGDAPPVFAPAALALLATVAHNGIPIAVGFLLIVGGDLKGEGLVVLEGGTAIETHAGDARDCEFDHQYVARLAGWVVTGRTVHRAYRALRKGLRVEAGSSLGILVVPKADRVLGHCISSYDLRGSFISMRGPMCNGGEAKLAPTVAHRRQPGGKPAAA